MGWSLRILDLRCFWDDDVSAVDHSARQAVGLERTKTKVKQPET